MAWELWWLAIPALILWLFGYRSRFWRILTVALAVAAVAFFPTLQQFVLGVTQQDTSVIRHYALDYEVNANGRQVLTETLDVQFAETRRGIFRFFDEADGVDPSVTHPVTIESVKRCLVGGTGKCVSEPYDVYYEDGYKVAKIGVASHSYPPGTTNRYIITSSTTGALTQPAGATEAQWYWNVIAPGWNMPIRRSRVTVTYPVAPSAVRCITETGTCDTTLTGKVVTGSYDGLPPRTPVTWQVDLPPEGLTVVPVSGTSQWWKTPYALIAGALAAVLMALLIWWLQERRAKKAPVFAEPTPDILPAVWTYREQAPDHPFQTMLLQLSALGTVRVEVPGDGPPDTDPQWVKVWRKDQPVPDITGAEDFITRLDLAESGSMIKIGKNSVSVGAKIKSTEATLERQSKTGAASAGFFGSSALGFLVTLVAAALAPAALLIMAWFQQRWLAAMLVLPALVGIWATRTLATRLTSAGMQMRDQVSGLRVALSTPASVERFDYAAKAQYFAQFLPWAVALDCADTWAEICAPPPGTEPGGTGYDPTYAAAWSTYGISNAVSDAVASVSAGAVSAYAATQSSSSGGGGGGFSSGGGSGGGGGGSW